MRESFLLTLALLGLVLPLRAQEQLEVNPATKPGSVQIVFLPPPMDGTISLGVYNKAGKLVRTLKREAVADKDFIVGLNGLMLAWDGKDDQGTAQKAGVYAVRGYMVKGVPVSGEAYRGNDWIEEEDSPRPREIVRISPRPGDRVGLEVKLSGGGVAHLEIGTSGPVRPWKLSEAEIAAAAKETSEKADGLGDLQPGHFSISEGKLVVGGTATLPELHQPVDFSRGKDGTLWLIDRSPERVEVQQYSAAGEFLRRLSVTAGEPVPEQIAASATSDLIFLLERAPGVQRVRGLALETLNAPLPAADVELEKPGAPKSSTWRIVFSKSIHASDDFASAADLLGRPEKPKPEAKVTVRLAKNPLGLKSDASSVEVVAVPEASGSFLQTVDGLGLCRLTDTPGLKWTAILKDAKGFGLVQSDGAVVEEYRLGKLTNMMPFDAGEYELKW